MHLQERDGLGSMVRVGLFMNTTSWIEGGFFFCFQRDELVFVLVVEERAAVAGALANRPFCAQVDAQKRLLKICPVGAKLV